jgi:hypothetical protein
MARALKNVHLWVVGIEFTMNSGPLEITFTPKSLGYSGSKGLEATSLSEVRSFTLNQVSN